MSGSLARVSVIVATDASGGISKDDALPWSSQADMTFFRDTTTGRGKNAVIMGRKTYETIPPKHRPLKNRHCCVVSRTWSQQDHPEVTVYNSLSSALFLMGASARRYDTIFVAGGEEIYDQIVDKYLYLCDRIYVSRFREEHECDKFFPWDKVKSFDTFKAPAKCRDFTRHYLSPDVTHEETRYLDLLREIYETGEQSPDRTGVGTRALFGRMLRFDISETIPLVTTKRVNFDAIVKELLFFVSGRTDTKVLEEQGVDIWKKNTSARFLQAAGLGEYPVGEMGPMYGFQWRHWGAPHDPTADAPADAGVDQLQAVVDGIIRDPHSRRHVVSAWNAADLPKMVLAPCHHQFQFNVSGDNRFLDCLVSQRSADCFLGLPFNVASYAILTYMVAHLCQLEPRSLSFALGNAHIYTTHATAVAVQLARTPKPFPRLRFEDAHRILKLGDFTVDNIVVDGYEHWPRIHADMAV